EFRRTKRRLSLAISMRAIDHEEMGLGNAIAAIAPGAGRVRLQIGVESEEIGLLNDLVVVDWGRRILTNVPYGPDFYPGIKIVGWIEEGGRVIRARVTRVEQPRTIEGVTLAFAFDEDLYLAAVRASRPLPQCDLKGAATLSDLVATVFHSRGTRTTDGGY